MTSYGASRESRRGFGLRAWNRVVPKGSARRAAEELAAKIAAFPPNCVKSDRASVYEQWHLPLDDPHC